MKTHTASYKELLAQRAALEQQIAAAREAEVTEAIHQVRTLVESLGLTHEDVFPPARKRRTTGLVAPRYQDPATGHTWTGRGKPPVWIKDKDRTQFEIQ